MPIDAGDVVLTFLGDTTDLDKAFDKVSDQAQGAKDDLGPVGDAVGGIGDKFKTVGTAAEGAGESTAAATSTIASGATAAAGALGSVETTVAGAASATTALASGAAEATTAISATAAAGAVLGEIIAGAFTWGVVLLFVEALSGGLTKLYEWQTSTEAFNAAWEKVEATFHNVDASLQQAIDKEQEKIIALTQGPVAALEFQLQHMGDAGAAALKAIDKELETLTKNFKENEGLLDTLVGTSGIADKDITEFKNKLDKAMRVASEQKPDDPLASLRVGIDMTTEKIIGLNTAIGGVEHSMDSTFSTGSKATLGLEEERDKLLQVNQQLQQNVTLQNKKVEVLTDKKGKVAQDEELKATKDATKAAADYAQQLIQNAKDAEKAQIASIDQVKVDQLKAFNDGKIGAGDLAVAEIKAANDSRVAHQAYLASVVDAYTKAGLGAKAYAAQQDLNLQKVKDAEKAEQDLGKIRQQVVAEQAKLQAQEVASWKGIIDEVNKATFVEGLLAKVDPFTPQIKKVLDLNNALKQVGVQGFLPLNQQLAATEKAEKLLNAAGIHDGQIWLQVQAAKLKAIIALDAAEGKSSKATIKELKDVEAQLKRTGTTAQHEMLDFQKFSKETLEGIQDAFTSAIAAWMAGQESFGAALEKALGQYLVQVGSKAAVDALYWTAWGIADSFWNPPRAGADFAAAAEFAAIAAVAGGAGAALSRGGNSSSKTDWTGGTGSTAQSDNGPATQSQPAPTGGQNVPHLAGGGLVTAPTLAVVGDSRNGGSAREAVLPLDNAEAMRSIAEAIGANGSGVTHNWYIQGGMISADTMSKVAKRVSRDVQSGRVRLKASDSARITRRS